jgi:hypothetical protein
MPGCTCGKPIGFTQQHKKHCPLSKPIPAVVATSTPQASQKAPYVRPRIRKGQEDASAAENVAGSTATHSVNRNSRECGCRGTNADCPRCYGLGYYTPVRGKRSRPTIPKNAALKWKVSSSVQKKSGSLVDTSGTESKMSLPVAIAPDIVGQTASGRLQDIKPKVHMTSTAPTKALSTPWSVPIIEGRRQADPIDQSLAVITGFVSLNDIQQFSPDNMPWINPRLFLENPSKKVPKKILESVSTEPKKLHRRNRGITVISPASTVLKDGLLMVDKWNEKSGLLDGGTTVSTLVSALPNLKKPGTLESYVRVEFLVGNYNEDDVVDISESRNTSQQVSSFAIANLAGEFDWIRVALKNKPILNPVTNQPAAVSIAYATNENGEIEVEDIIQELALFMMASPQGAYSSKQKALADYEANKGDYENMQLVLADIVALADFIPYAAKKFYGDGFGDLVIIGASGLKGDNLPVVGSKTSYGVHKAWVFPLLAAFEPVLNKSVAPFEWTTDPYKLYEKTARKLFDALNNCFSQDERNLNAIGKKFSVYALLREIVKHSM